MQGDNITSLFQKYINRELSEKELEQLQDWLKLSPTNRRLFVSFLSLYKTEIQLAAGKQMNVDAAWNRINRQLNKSSRKHNFRAWAAAASILLIIGLSIFIYQQSSFKNDMTKGHSLTALYPNMGDQKAILTLSDGRTVFLKANDKRMNIREKNGNIVGYNLSNHLIYETLPTTYKVPLYNKITVPVGSEYMVTLSDGTKVWLNSESTLEYPVAFSSIRNVRLRGEAYFEVTHDAHAPFVVHTHEVQVRVLGTKFNVSAYHAERISVTLVEGKVAVTSAQGTDILTPGNQAKVFSTGKHVIEAVNPAIYTSWVTGRFEFNDTPMKDIMTQLSLWYNVKIEFASPELENITFTGAILKSKSLGYALELIQKVSNLDFQKEGETIVVKEQKN